MHELTWSKITRIWWALTWRNGLALLLSLSIIFFLTFCVQTVFNLIGLSEEVATFVMIPLGTLIGLAISIVPVRYIVGRNLGGFRLVLEKVEPGS